MDAPPVDNDGILAKWRAGWILFLRHLWLSFCLALLMAPARYLAYQISRDENSLFSAGAFHPQVAPGMAVALLWLPFAIWLATQMSGQTIVYARGK